MTQYGPQARLLLWARALREGKDMHRIRAAEMFSVPESEVTPEQRRDRMVRRLQRAPLIAAMRCYVASKLGEEVEVPDTLE